MTAQGRINEQLAFGASSARKATCTGIDWVNGVATVNVPGNDLSLPMVGVPPIINELCWIGSLGNSTVVLGPVPRPPYATVTGSPSGGLVTVLCDDTIPRNVTYQGADPTIGTRVLIDWTGGGAIVLAPLADPNTGFPLLTPGAIHPAAGLHSRTFNPYTSGTWRDGYFAFGWVGGVPWDSDHNRGAWFYQGIADTIPDTATNGTLKIFIPGGDGYGGNPSIGAHALTGPAGTLSITGRKVIPASGGWIDVSEFFDSFKTGALRGIGTGGGGNWKFPAAGQNNSGAIAATWRS